MKFTATDLIESTKNLEERQDALRVAQAQLKAAEKLDEAIRLNYYPVNLFVPTVQHLNYMKLNVDSYLSSHYKVPSTHYRLYALAEELFSQYDDTVSLTIADDTEAVAALLMAGKSYDAGDHITASDVAMMRVRSDEDGAAELAEMMIAKINNPAFWVKKS